jgi:hypothetical protein
MFSIQEQLHRRNVKRFRGGLVFKAHRLVYHSALGSRVRKSGREKMKVLSQFQCQLDVCSYIAAGTAPNSLLAKRERELLYKK